MHSFHHSLVPVAVIGALAIFACAPRVAPVPEQAGPIRLENSALRVSFDARDGRLVELIDLTSGTSLVAAGTDTGGLWRLYLMAGAEVQSLEPARAREFRSSRVEGDAALLLIWEGFGLPAAPMLRVTAHVRLQGSTPVSAWRIQLEGLAGLGVDSVAFPRVTGIPSLGAGEELAVPVWMGQRTREPRRVLAGPEGSGRRLEWFYPGQLSLQALALYRSGGAGLYAAADDSLAYRKSFAVWGEPGGTAGYEMVHLPAAEPRDRFVMPYSAIIGTFTGDWLTAAERYREWGVRQRWARESRLARGQVPGWVTNTGLWIWNRGRSSGVLEPAAMLQREAELPVSVFWHWWHKGAYDTSFPDYLPPREGTEPFRQALAQAHARGLNAIVYMNQRLWCLDTPSWEAERAERWAVRKSDGTIRTEVYNIFDPKPCATMDVTTQGWRDKYGGIAEEVLNDYRLDGIYMDQAVLSLVCYSADHGHPVGGGNYWMEGFARLADEIRDRADSASTALAGEGGGESWLPELDMFLTLQVSMERYAEPTSGWEPIPFFQSVYHAYGITYGSYSSLAHPPYDDLWPAEHRPATALQPLDLKYRRQFYLEQARAFVWGMQPTIANFLPWQLTERREQIAFAVRLARLRSRVPQYLLRGTMLRPPTLNAPETDVTISRVSIYAARRGGVTEYVKRAPSALAGAWRSPDGGVAIALASIAEEPQSLALTLDPALYGLRGGGRIWRYDDAGRREIGSFGDAASTLTVDLPALGAVVLELEPR